MGSCDEDKNLNIVRTLDGSTVRVFRDFVDFGLRPNKMDLA